MSARSRGLTFAALAIAVLTVQLVSAQADGGALEPAFGIGGVVITPTPPRAETENAGLYTVAVQADGKIVVGGQIHPAASPRRAFAVARYKADGSLDPTFGSDGLVTTDFGVDWEGVRGLAIQPDRKIVAAGVAYGGIALARYNPDGTPDVTFGSGPVPGTVVSDVLGEADGVVLQPDGKIVVTGGTALARYNADGSVDGTFGDSGYAWISSGGLAENGTGLALTPDGEFIVVGSRENSLNDPGPDRSFLVERYKADGSPDTSFGSGGVATAKADDWDYGNAVAVQPDGRILVAGSRQIGSQELTALVRFQPNGALDSSFGNHGVADDDPYVEAATSVLLQPDGKIVVVGDGFDFHHPGDGFGIARYLPDGSPDSSFGTNGNVTTTFGPDAGVPFAAALQADGKIVAAGSTWATVPPSDEIIFALARYLTEDSHSLSLMKADATGSGGVTSQPLGIACDTICREDSAQFADQSLVTLTAHPLAGTAVSWSGACAGSGRVCTVTMQQAAQSVHVKFSRCVVPRLRSKKAAAAKIAIRHAHCSVGHTKTKRSQRVAKGRVISQHPASGSNLPAGSRVSVVISKGRGH